MEPTPRAVWEQAHARVESALREAEAAASPDAAALERLRVRFLGRKGELGELLKALKDLPLELRRELGPKGQALKDRFEAAVAARRAQLEDLADAASLAEEGMDLTLPAVRAPRGRLHPLTTTMREITRVFESLGYSWAEGPLVEDERHNFSALNMPEDHPARDMLDTFYLAGPQRLLRTHTSTVQIRTMDSQRPPLKVVAAGRVFRHEQIDATHSAVFHQVEGLVVDRRVTFADLKDAVQTFLQRLLGARTKTLFRPSFFPFTEPSADVYASCPFCGSKGCPTCKHGGWIELLGAGIVNPAVFRAVGYDPEQWSGFAFGIGVERVAMLLHGVSDLRDFYSGDLRFLRQFDEDLV